METKLELRRPKYGVCFGLFWNAMDFLIERSMNGKTTSQREKSGEVRGEESGEQRGEQRGDQRGDQR